MKSNNFLYFNNDSPSLLLSDLPNFSDPIDRDMVDSTYPIDVDGHRCDCLHSLINDQSGTLNIINMPSLAKLPSSSDSIPESIVDDVLDSSNPLSPNRRCDTLVERQTRFDLLHDYSEFNKQILNQDVNETDPKKLPLGSSSSSSEPDNSGSD